SALGAQLSFPNLVWDEDAVSLGGMKGRVAYSLPFLLISILSRLIFWFRVDNGTLNRSAVSVWLPLHFSSMSVIMRRSHSSTMSNREASARCSRMGNTGLR